MARNRYLMRVYAVMSEDMVQDGYTDIVNIDISDVSPYRMAGQLVSSQFHPTCTTYRVEYGLTGGVYLSVSDGRHECCSMSSQWLQWKSLSMLTLHPSLLAGCHQEHVSEESAHPSTSMYVNTAKGV